MKHTKAIVFQRSHAMPKKRTDGRYQLSKTINGKRKYFYGKTKKEALEKLELYMSMYGDCKNFNPLTTFGDLANQWLMVKKTSVRQTTYEVYVSRLQSHILPHLRAIPLTDMSVASFRQAFEKIKTTGLGNSSLRLIHGIIKSILQQAVDDEIIAKNYMSKIPVPPKPSTKKQTLSQDDVKLFLSSISDVKYKTMFHLAFYTGLRRGELLGLRWSDINFNKSTLSISQTIVLEGNDVVISPTTKTSASTRTIKIDAKTLEMLSKYKLYCDTKNRRSRPIYNYNLVFSRPNGQPIRPTALSDLAKTIGRRLGFNNFTMHSTRHTHATQLIEQNANVKAVQLRLGHASITQTMDTYVHNTDDLESSVIEILEKL